MNRPAVTWRSFRHWSLHVVLSASASFSLACRTDWHSAEAVTGMLAGMVFFVGLFTWVWDSPWFRRHAPEGGFVYRALLYGTRLRSGVGVLGLVIGSIFRPDPSSLFFSPDLWAGVFAFNLIRRLGSSAPLRALRVVIGGNDPATRAHSMLVGDTNSLLPTFLITVTDGVLLTLMLLVLAYFCLQVLKAYARPPSALAQCLDL